MNIAPKRSFEAGGIPTVPEEIVADPAHAEAAAAALGYPVVMKGLLPGGVHKTELGLVRMGIHDGRTARLSFDILVGRMEGRGKVLIQKQHPGRVELILGLLRDPQFGPCVMFGPGGVMAELYDDTAFAVAPLTHGEALKLIDRVRSRKILDGFRGAPPVDREAIARILVTLGEIGLNQPRIREIDINPLIVGEEGAAAVRRHDCPGIKDPDRRKCRSVHRKLARVKADKGRNATRHMELYPEPIYLICWMSFSLPTTTRTSPSLMTKSAAGTIWNLPETISRMAMTSI